MNHWLIDYNSLQIVPPCFRKVHLLAFIVKKHKKTRKCGRIKHNHRAGGVYLFEVKCCGVTNNNLYSHRYIYSLYAKSVM